MLKETVDKLSANVLEALEGIRYTDRDLLTLDFYFKDEELLVDSEIEFDLYFKDGEADTYTYCITQTDAETYDKMDKICVSERLHDFIGEIAKDLLKPTVLKL